MKVTKEELRKKLFDGAPYHKIEEWYRAGDTLDATLDRMIIWYQCWIDAELLCGSNAVELVASRLRDGNKPKTMEGTLGYINARGDERFQQIYINDLISFYKK